MVTDSLVDRREVSGRVQRGHDCEPCEEMGRGREREEPGVAARRLKGNGAMKMVGLYRKGSTAPGLEKFGVGGRMCRLGEPCNR